MTDYRTHEERAADAKADAAQWGSLVMNTTATTDERVRALLELALQLVRVKEELRSLDRERGEEEADTADTAALVYNLLAGACYLDTEIETQERCWQCGHFPSLCSCPDSEETE